MSNAGNSVSASFRDPSGFVLHHEGVFYRQVNVAYRDNYDHLMNSGLYKSLIKDGLMIPHEEQQAALFPDEKAYKLLKPQQIGFISYPYEWCFAQTKDAALTTLAVQKRAFEFGMVLKDASGYNIQFLNGKPVLIDTLSFAVYEEGTPWVAYRQFCQHFLAPLVLMSYTDIRLNQLLRIYIDGIPLDLASRLLPFRTRFKAGLLMHIHLHAKGQQRFADKAIDVKTKKMSKLSFMGLVDSLESAVRKLNWTPKGTEWAQYYEDTNYSPEAMEHKEAVVEDFLGQIKPKVTWDLGANTGRFSRIAARKGSNVISFDIDPAAVQKNYLEQVRNGRPNILPLILDLSNPSGGIGWENQERKSFIDRGPADAVLALALIHHLAISNNVPLASIAEFFSKICNWLIIEFVPKDDSQIQGLLAAREDIFDNYTCESFQDQFRKYFQIQKTVALTDSKRTLYLMKKIP